MDDDVVESSQDNVAEEIKPINRDTVHKICSGQVLINYVTSPRLSLNSHYRLSSV